MSNGRLENSNFIAAALTRWIRERPDAEVFLSDTARRVTYRDLSEHNTRLLDSLNRGGLLVKSPLLIYLPHSLEKALVLTSLLATGRPGLALSTRVSVAEVQDLVLRYKFAGLITSSFFAKHFDNFVFTKTLVLDSLHILSREGAVRPDLDWLLATSGSTGHPKLVKISQTNLEQRTRGEIKLLNLNADDLILNCLSFAHDLGLNQLLTALISGAKLKILSSAFPSDMIQHLSDPKLKGLTGTPMLWSEFMQVARAKELSPLAWSGYLTISGGALDVGSLIELRHLFPHARMIKTYGQSETFRSFAETRLECMERDTIGQPLAGVQVAVVDDGYKACAVGEVGQLLHAGVGTMTGYLDDDGLTAQKMIQVPELGLCVQTGDYFRVLADGEYQFVGRRDDMAKHLDHRLYLSEVENALLTCGWLAGARVLCLDSHEPRGAKTKLVAWVVPKIGHTVTSQALHEYGLRTMASYKVPKEYYVLDSFPKTASGKIDSQSLLRSLGAPP